MYIWMSLQAKCHRCGCTQPPSTFGWWLVACKSKQGIWEKNFENFLFRIFKTRFQSFLKTFWCFEKLFLKILQILILSNGTRHTWTVWLTANFIMQNVSWSLSSYSATENFCMVSTWYLKCCHYISAIWAYTYLCLFSLKWHSKG